MNRRTHINEGDEQFLLYKAPDGAVRVDVGGLGAA